MDTSLATALVVLVIVLVVIGAVAFGVWRARMRARELAQAAFGTDSLLEGFKQTETAIANTPRSVSSMTSIYLPQIHKDFPEFNWNDMRMRSDNVLKSYLMAIDGRDPSMLSEGSRELRDALRLHLASLHDAGQVEQFDQVKIHRTEIANYEKRNGRCTVRCQSAVQYKHAVFDEAGVVVSGDAERWTQARYDVDIVYIQDQDKVRDDRDRADAVNCPNCGAPVTNLGAKKCAYCGSALEPYNIRVWSFHKVEES